MGFVYKIECVLNGKIYIGSTCNIKKRFWEHKHYLTNGNHHNRYLQNAWNKYGEDYFNFSLLETTEDNSILLDIEQKWLDFYQSYEFENGYNLCPNVKQSALGRKVSDETKHLISIANKGRELSENHKQKLSEKHKGKTLSWETRLKLSLANKGRIKSPEECGKISKSKKGIATIVKTWIVYYPNKKDPIMVENLKDFCRKNSLNYSVMMEVAKGRSSHHKGWLCRRYIRCGEE